MKILFLLPCLFLLPTLSAAQCCCCLKRDAGQTAYNNGKYETAIAKWQDAKKCSDAASCTNLDNLIAGARNKIKQREEAADDDAWELVKDSQDSKTVQKYLDKYPKGRHAAKARNRIKELSSSGTTVNIESRLSLEPEMLKITGGAFLMGSTDSGEDFPPMPVHSVNVGDFYLGKYEVTNREYCAFLNEKGNQTEGGKMWINLNGSFEDERCRIRQINGTFTVESGYENYPVIYVNWHGAKAYVNWLATITGKKYRLPTEAEWEYAAGNGSRHTKYSWGNGSPFGKQGGNIADETYEKKFPNSDIFTGYNDRYLYTAPVGSFNANDFNLHDMSGNVREWCEDVWHNSYEGAPTDGSAWLGDDDHTTHISRGGDWSDIERFVRISSRTIYGMAEYFGYYGFRVAQGK